MKNLNLIKRLWTDSHEKQSPQRFIRYVVMLIMLLTLGVGQMWAADASNANVYYDNTSSNWSDVQLFIGHSTWSSVSSMTKLTNSNNLYYLRSFSWGGYGSFYFTTGASGWDSRSEDVDKRVTYTTHYSAKKTDNLSSSTWLFISSGGSNGSSVSGSTVTSYDKLNYQQTVQQTLSTDGGSTYSASTASLATVKVASYYLSSATATSASSTSGTISAGNSSANCKAVRTATVTYTVSSVATGYTFVGWYDGSTQKSTSTTYTYNATGAKTITARFKENRYSLTFSHNGHGTIAVGGNTVASGSTAYVNYFTTKTLVATPNTGYNFSGWTKSGSNTGSVTIGNAANASTTIKATNTGATITAGFTPKTTTITFDKQGGIDGSDGVTATYDAAMPDITLPEKNGYTFGGYWGAPGGSGPKYYNADGSSAQNWNNTESTYKLFAKWTENMSAISLVASPTGKGSFTIGGDAATSTTAGVTTTRSVTAVAITGYHFVSWAITGGATISGTTDNPVTVTGGGAGTAATLTATFAADAENYTITYGVGNSPYNNGSVSEDHSYPSGSSQTSGTEISLTATPTNAHYKLEGWYTTAACATPVAGAGTNNPYEFTLGANTSVYAKFILKQCTITLNKNGGSTGAASVTASHGSTLPAFTAHSRTGYTLQGYYTDPSAGTKIINADGSLVASTSYADANKKWNNDATALTLYAQWTANTYTVSFNKQSGSGGDNSVTATFGAAMPSITAPTRTGYDFNGYYGSTGGSGTKYYNADGSSANVWDVANATTIYAYWTAHNYTITYSPSSAPTGCTYTTKPTSCAYGNTATIVITPSTGYTVSVSARDASSNVVTLSNPSANTYTFTQPASNVTITVTTTETKSIVTVNANQTSMGTLKFGETSKSWGTTASVGVTTSQSIKATANSGYVFDRWVLSGGAASPTTLTNATITLKANGSGSAGTAKAVFGKTYYYRGDKNSWGANLMTRHEDGYYAYYQTSGTHTFQCTPVDNSWDVVYYTCDNSYGNITLSEVDNGYGGTKVSCPESGSHYICILYPGTAVNDGANPLIFASTTLPDLAPETTYATTFYAGNHGAINAKGTAIAKNGNASVNIGSTARALTATPESGYSFDKWVTTGSVTVTDPYSASTTVSASAAGGTVTATYLQNSGWYLQGGFDNYDTWETSAKALPVDRPYRGISGVYYRPFSTLDNGDYFGMHDGTNKYSGHTATDKNYDYNSLDQVANLYVNSSQSFQAKTSFSNKWAVIKTTGTKIFWIQNPETCHTVTVSNDGNGTKGTVVLKTNNHGNLATYQYANGETIQVEIDTVAHYSIASVTLGSTPVSMSHDSGTKFKGTAVMPNNDVTLTVTYTPWYKITLAASPAAAADAPTAAKTTGGASVANNSYVLSGTSVTFTYDNTPNTGYSWGHWENNNTNVGTGSTYVTTISETTAIKAVYSENMFNVSASASPAAGGSVTPTSATSMGQVNGGNITASPNAGYSFTNWTISSGSGYFGASGTATTSTTANTKFRPTAATTLTATFAEIMRTVAVNVNNAAFGSVSTTSLTSVGPATASAEVTATPVDGATFTRWDVVSGITIADGYTNTSNPVKINATAAGKTITANFTETMHTVTLSTADGSKGTVGSNQSVGQITAVQITATPKSGYMFSKWVKTAGSGTVTYYTGAGNGQVEDASGEEKETTYITVTGNVTLQATWEADRSSGYVVHYGNSGKNADGGTDASQTRPWKDGKLYRATTEASDISYFTFTAGVGDVDKVIEFKIWETSSNNWDHWYGYNSNDGGKIDGNISNVTLNTSYGNGRLCITMPGSYLFTWDKSTNKLSIRYPNDVYYVRGGFNSWDWSHPMTETSSGVYSATVNMTEANHTYSGDNGFKLLIAGQYYGKDGTTVTRSTSTGSAAIGSCSTSGANIGITTDYTGNYTFTYTVASNTLQVTYPTAYKVTYGKGSVDGSASNCSAVDIDNSSAAVTSNSTWVKSGNRVVLTAPAAKSGYRYLGWYDNNSATGDAITTNANCTITVSSALTRYACYAENLSAITITTDGHGTITTPSPNSSPYNLGVTTTQAINASANTGYSWSTWTTSGNAALGTTATTASNTAKGNGTNGGTGTITATFTPNNYDVVLDVNGATTGSDQTVTATFDATMPTTQKGGSTPISAPSKTGYNFDGYTKNNNGTGTKYYTSALANNHVWDIATNNTHIYAKWDAKQSTLSFDYQTSATGYGTSGTVSAGSKATYDAEMPTLSGTLPTAANGYAFMGFYSATGGSGTKYYNADGTSANNWAEDTESTTTLYAYYQQAEITALAFDALNVDAGGTVGVTPTIDPTPVGDKIICWTILHDNDSPLDPQPEKTWDGTKLTFTAPAYSGTYKVQAVLRTGLSCGGGTELDTRTESFTVAGTHTVTVNYKCGDDVIKTATSETATPLDWSGDITAPDIFGYTFTRWDAADGVTIKNGEFTPVTTSTDATIKIKATYNGKLTAVYTQKSMIYFKNTLGWSNVYVNFYESSYWNNPNGSGNQSVAKRNLAMTRYGETDIWYYDYGAASITPGLYVSFTSESQDNTQYFWKSGGVNVVYPANYADDIHTDKSSENGFKAATPMFVPLATQEKVTLNQSSGGKADYYNAGYWTKYTPGTGYRLEIYNNSTGAFIKAQDFTSADELMPMKAVLDLEGGTTYKFQLRRGGESSAGIYYGNTGTMTYSNHGQGTPWAMTNTMTGDFQMAKITTNTAGSYTFHLSYSPNASDEYRLRIAVDYPISTGDYRLLYSDAVQTKPLTSAIVTKENDGSDIVSFFVRPGSTPVLRIQQATVANDGKVTWKEYPTDGTPTNQITGTIATTITSGGKEVYNFNLSMDGEGALSVASVEKYTGNFYIRTDAANSKWDNYKTDPDHLMTYSEYSIEHGGYTHYYCHWVKSSETGRKNVKFVIANDYSPNISDTLARETASGTWENIASFMEEGGDLKRDANVRFMWDKRDNTISRAYVDGAQGDYSANFLYMLNVEAGADKIRKSDESALTDHKVTFKDNGNWMYEANIQAQPDAKIKLLSNWGTSNTITQYFRGASDATETLIGGSGSNWYDIRLIYDFKTNRLIAGLIPSGTIDEQMAIHADVMFIREHQDDIAQLTFAEKDSKMGAITDIETAFGVLRFNKWTINNKSKADGHAPLVPALSRYERDLFYVSFPFRVAMEDVFGFGTYGQHWIIEYYDGASRAANGYWLESGPNWKFVTNRKGKYFEPGQGYIIALDLDELGESSSVWANTDQVELYFPSYGTMPNITSSTATYEIPSHKCTINRTVQADGVTPTGLPAEYDRRVRDSHWNVLGVPTYVNPAAPSYANTDWETEFGGPNFLYQVSWTDNSVSPVSSSTFTYHAMHAYLVQYCGNVTWTSSVSPSLAPRRNPEYRGNFEFRLEMLQNDKAVDRAFVKLSDDEHVTTGFEFNYDMSKEFNSKKANIYTLIGSEPVAGNVLPLTEQTTVVPVGVKIAANGDYTFSMPDGTEGTGITLIDNETGIRTPLGALDYTINLSAGTYDNRFVLEIAPIKQMPTDIELLNGEIGENGVRKVMIDGILYIVKGGKMFDATGRRVE